ncbi:MAG: HAMP domain-containing sensor histidine kinase [Proteobacteria bacterium]|nr:HAMP domain-containing sensor histidine kinase [Pseudomonadota bacterium]
MTPELVIHRYLHIAGQHPLDRAALLCLVTTDADLLAGWLILLGCEPRVAALQQALERLSDSQLQHLALAQASKTERSARISFPRWRDTLMAAALVEQLAVESALAHPEDLRLLTLLALSGTVLPGLPAVQNLIDLRGTRADLYEDAQLSYRLFAVADALEQQGEEGARRHAAVLLAMETDRFADILGDAQSQVRGLLSQIGLREDIVETGSPIWIHQQVSALGRLFEQGEQLLDAHLLASASLFDRTPLLLVLKDRHLTLLGEGPAFAISIDSQASALARVARRGVPEAVQKTADQAVVDRQLHQWFASDQVALYPVMFDGHALAVLAFGVDEENDDEYAMGLYALELASWLKREEDGHLTDNRLEDFRTLERKRLREIVHEANNPLSIVQNYLHILELRLQHEPSATQQIDLISNEIARTADIIAKARDVPELAADEPDDELLMSAIAVNDVVRNVVTLHTGMADNKVVELKLDLTGDEPIVQTDEQRLKQVLTNLLKNAIEPCAPGDQIVASTTSGVVRQGRRVLEVSIRDNGPGLRDEVMANLFDPKESSTGGSGLGLHIVYRLVVELQAEIDVRSHPSHGTTFSLFLPVSP